MLTLLDLAHYHDLVKCSLCGAVCESSGIIRYDGDIIQLCQACNIETEYWTRQQTKPKPGATVE